MAMGKNMAGSREDAITLSGIRVHPRIGTTAEERSAPQECMVDLKFWGDFEAAALTDSLDKSIDYTAVLSLVEKTAGEREYNLVETLAYGIAGRVLRHFPVDRVRVRVRKRPAVLVGAVDYVEIEVEESRS